MSEDQLTAFGRHVETLVDLPELAPLADRGHRLRRRRQTIAASVVGVVALGAGYLSTVDVGGERIAPVDESQVRPYPGSSAEPKLAPGRYELELYREGAPATARFTVPPGWSGWYGPRRTTGGFAVLVVGDVDEVATSVCRSAVSEMRPVGDRPEDLVDAFEALPRYRVVDGPEQTVLDGLPATHLTMLASRDATCPGPDRQSALEIWNSPGSGGLIPTLGPRTTLDLWVVDLAGEAVLVSASTAPGTSAAVRAELDAVVDSVELVPGS